MRKRYHSDHWITEKDIPELHDLGVNLQSTAQGTKIGEKDGTHEVFYHAEQTTNPLRLQKELCEFDIISASCADFLTGAGFSLQDIRHLIRFRYTQNFESRNWIRHTDLKKLGAILFPDEEEHYIECFSGLWYNFDQLMNKGQVIRAKLEFRKSILTARQNDQSFLKVLSDIFDAQILLCR